MSELPFLESLKASDHMLSAEEILNLKVDKDKIFRDSDKVGHVCTLGPSMSPPQPQNDATLDIVFE